MEPTEPTLTTALLNRMNNSSQVNSFQSIEIDTNVSFCMISKSKEAISRYLLTFKTILGTLSAHNKIFCLYHVLFKILFFYFGNLSSIFEVETFTLSVYKFTCLSTYIRSVFFFLLIFDIQDWFQFCRFQQCTKA